MSKLSLERGSDDDGRRMIAAQVGKLAAEGRWGANIVADKPWLVRDVPEHTRREVKVYAAARGITVAEALEEIVSEYLQLAAVEADNQRQTIGADVDTMPEQS